VSINENLGGGGKMWFSAFRGGQIYSFFNFLQQYHKKKVLNESTPKCVLKKSMGGNIVVQYQIDTNFYKV